MAPQQTKVYDKTVKSSHIYVTTTIKPSNHFITVYSKIDGKIKTHKTFSAGNVLASSHKEGGSKERISAKTKTSQYTLQNMYNKLEAYFKTSVKSSSATIKIQGIDGNGRHQAIKYTEAISPHVEITEIIYRNDASFGGCRPKKRRRI